MRYATSIARAALFELIATDVARSFAPEGIAVLRAALAEMERACRTGDLNGYVWANVDFYDHNTRLANNRIVNAHSRFASDTHVAAAPSQSVTAGLAEVARRSYSPDEGL